MGGCGKYLANSHSWNYWSQGKFHIDLSKLTPEERLVVELFRASTTQWRTHIYTHHAVHDFTDAPNTPRINNDKLAQVVRPDPAAEDRVSSSPSSADALSLGSSP